MKKVLLLAAIAVFGLTSVNAQDDESTGGFSQGDVFISGSVLFNSVEDNDLTTSEFTISPKVGFFLTENIALGANIGFRSRTDELGSGLPDVDTNAFNIGVFGRYYFMPANKFSLFAELGLDYVTATSESGSSEADANGFEAKLAPGISYFLSNNFAIEASVALLRYSTLTTEVPGIPDRDTNTFTFGGDWTNVTFGVIYKF